jgi:hypothetical protein
MLKKIGLVLLIFGSGPLIAILLLSKIGVGDPNPNPIGFGLLAGLTFPLALIFLVIGLFSRK